MSDYYQINWVNGMKITSGHFVDLENHFINRIQSTSKGFIHPLSYGLLPPAEGEPSVPEFAMAMQEGKIKSIRSLSVITPEGQLAQIPANVDFKIHKPETEASKYYLVVAVKPYIRLPFGQINELENPLRFPFAVAESQFYLLPHTHTAVNTFGNSVVPLAQCAGGSYEPDKSYIPPCTSLQSHPALGSVYTKLKTTLDELERKVLELLKKPNVTNRPMLVNLISYFNQNKASVDWYLPFLPPVFLVEKLNQLARVILFSTEIQNIGTKEEQKALLLDLINFKYDHLDTGKAMAKVTVFLDNYSKFLPKDENIFGV